MADKTPVRVVYNSSNVATGLAEYQSGDTVGTSFGGTGLTSIGTAGQVLKVNAAADGLEFGAEGDISITNLVAPSNADLTFTTSGTGNIVLDGLTVRGTTLSAADSSTININEGLVVDGTATVSGALSSATSLALASGATVTAILDEDAMGSNSATGLATQQSIKAYVDSGTVTMTNKSIDLANNTLTGSLAEWNSALQSDSFVSLTGTETLTNKTLTSPTINGGTFSGTFTGDINPGTVTTNNIVANGSNADINITPSGTGDVVISSLRVNGTTIDSSDSSAVQINENTEVDGTLTVTGAVAITSGTITGITDLTVADGGTGASSLTDNAVLTGTGTSAITAEGNLSFDGSTLAVTGAATVSTTLGVTGATTLSGGATILGLTTTGSLTTNAISANGSNADISIQSSGTGDVIISSLRINGTTLDSSDSSKVTIAEAVDVTGALTFSGLALPTSDGDNGQAIVTDGSGTLSFGTVSGKSASDDSLGVGIANKIITSTARTIDSFHATFQDSVFYVVVSNDHYEDCVNVHKVSLCHNNSDAFVSSAGIISKAAGTTTTTFSADLSNDMVRLKAASSNAVGGRASFYKFGLGDNSSAATSGNIIVSQNTDVDSASESLVSFAHASYRGAKLFVSINNDAKTEVGNIEALVVHDGTTGYISVSNQISSGSNDLITLTAAIDGSNLVVSAAGGEANLRVTVHAIMLKDTMTSDDGTYANTEAIAPVTVSSTATEVDTLVETTDNGALYYFVSKNASEGTYAVNEVFVASGSGECAIANAGFVSTKGTNQLAFTSDYKDDVEATASILASSTSGGSTTVSAYRLNALAK